MVTRFLANCGSANMAEKKITKKLTCMVFLYMISLRNKTVAHNFLLSLENANYGHGKVTSHFPSLYRS